VAQQAHGGDDQGNAVGAVTGSVGVLAGLDNGDAGTAGSE
jgi:hypothetical protein